MGSDRRQLELPCCQTGLHRSTVKQLEATLGIHEGQPGDQSHNQIEEPSGVLPKQRLTDVDQRAVDGS